MNDLEQALVALGRELEFPPAPNLAPRVRARLARRRRGFAWRLVAVAMAAVAVAVGAALAVPQARSAILRFFHLGGATIVRVETLPPARERPLAANLGRRVPIHRVYLEIGIDPRLPRDDDSVSHGYVSGEVVSFVLRVHGKTVLLTELRGAGLVKKAAIEETRVEPVKVNDHVGYWIAGRRHVVEILETPPRLAGNVLIWEDGNVTLRLEGPLSKDDALEFARSIR